jgi:hypothetical protein
VSGFQDWVLGTTDGDRTGDKVLSVFTKIKAMLQELYALVGSGTGYLAPAAITAASTNNYDPGSSWPTAYSWLDLNPSTNDITLTGLKAGTDGQSVTIRNIGTTYNITLSAGGVTPGTGDTSSTAANRFTGAGDAGIVPGAHAKITYRALPSPSWAIG